MILQGGWHEAQSVIDGEILASKSTAAILELRTRRNSYAPISKLLVELLEEIFVVAKELPRLWIPRYTDDRGWLNVAHVCRNWREVALNAPRLWNELDVSNIRHLDWVTESLWRSQNALLHVKCTDSEREIGFLSVILAHMDRIRHLEFNSNATRNPTGFSKVMDMIGMHDAHGRLLQFLCFHNQTPQYNSDGIHRIFRTVQMDHLQTLNITLFTLPQTIPLLPRLRHFSYYPPKEAAAKMTTATIVSLLRKTPALERLEVCVHTLATSDDECMPVDLTHLSFISYTTEELIGPSVLRFIHYPPSARVKFTVQGTHPRAALCIDEFTAIISHMGCGGDAAAIDTLTLNANFGNFFMAACIRRETVLELLISMSTVIDDVIPLFALSDMLPASAIRNLQIAKFPSLQEEDWESFFRRHVQVQTLFCSEVNPTFILSLSKPPGAHQSPFPELKIFHLYNCEIRRRSFIASVERFLKERLDLSSPIDLLKIGSCRITKDMIRRLEAYVKVEWDGHERFIDDYSNGEEEEDEEGDDS